MAKSSAKKSGSSHSSSDPNNQIIQISQSYYEEAKQARQSRMDKNTLNYDIYNLRQDYSFKREGQSREFLPKQMLAVEQISTFFEQGVTEVDDWYKIEPAPGMTQEEMMIKPEEIQKLLDRQIEKADFKTFIHDAFKLGLLGSLSIAKVGGKRVPVVTYAAESTKESGRVTTKLKKTTRTVWQADLTLINPEDYYPDPSGKLVYQMHQAYLDLFEVKALSEGEDAIYDKDVVDKIKADFSEDWKDQLNKARRTGMDVQATQYRLKVKLQEYWGKIVDRTTGELLYDNVVWTVANDKYLIQKPVKNPYWHGECPIIVTPIVRVPNSVWHRALMDAPTRHNMALNELYNLMLDAGMMATYGIKQYRPDWLADASLFDEGFTPGDSVAVNSNCPPGAKAIERVDTSSMSPESLQMFQIVNSEFTQAAVTNDARMGSTNGRKVSATEVVESSQTITNIFTGIARRLENDFVCRILDMMWKNGLQHMDDLYLPEVQAILGKDRANVLANMSAEERFANSVNDSRFSVFGISRILKDQQDFRKLTAFLQTVSGSPLLIQEFTRTSDMGRFLDEIMRTLGISADRIRATPEEQAAAQARMQQIAQMAMGQQGGAQNGPMEASLAVDQSQVPQAGTGYSNDIRAQIPQANFPRQAPRV